MALHIADLVNERERVSEGEDEGRRGGREDCEFYTIPEVVFCFRENFIIKTWSVLPTL